MIAPSSLLSRPAFLPKPGQLAGAASQISPFFFTTPSRFPVGRREGRLLSERLPAGLGASAHADVFMLFKAINSRIVSTFHHALDMLFHATAKLCAAQGQCGDRGKKSDDGECGHVMRSDVTRTRKQIFFEPGPIFVGRFLGTGIPPVVRL